MTGLVECNSAAFALSHNLSLLLQTADYTVYGIEEVLFAYKLLVVAGSYQRSLVAHIGYVGTRESRSLTCKHVDVHGRVGLHRS